MEHTGEKKGKESMKHRVSHGLTQERAKAVAVRAWEEYAQKYARFHPTCTWSDDTRAAIAFSAKGVQVTGDITLEPGAIAFEMKVPLLLRMFQKQAMGAIEAEVRKWVARAEAE